MTETHYDILAIKNDATDRNIKKAFYREARKWHPDKNLKCVDHATKRFQRIGEAYEVLSDLAKRKQYDAQIKSSQQNIREKHSSSFSKSNKHHQQKPAATEPVPPCSKYTQEYIDELLRTVEAEMEQQRKDDLTEEYSIEVVRAEVSKIIEAMFHINEKFQDIMDNGVSLQLYPEIIKISGEFNAALAAARRNKFFTLFSREKSFQRQRDVYQERFQHLLNRIPKIVRGMHDAYHLDELTKQSLQAGLQLNISSILCAFDRDDRAVEVRKFNRWLQSLKSDQPTHYAYLIHGVGDRTYNPAAALSPVMLFIDNGKIELNTKAIGDNFFHVPTVLSTLTLGYL